MINNYHCYFIQNVTEISPNGILSSTESRKTKTYIGSTTNFTRRIRQHNREICGGARYTAGNQWKPAIILSGFASWPQTLRFEYIWKHIKLQNIYSRSGINRRIEILEYLLKKEEWSHLTVWTNAEIACNLDCSQPICDLDELFH